MILTPWNDPFFNETLATPIPSPSGLPQDMINPAAMVFRVGENVAIPMDVPQAIEYMFGGELEEREEEIGLYEEDE